MTIGALHDEAITRHMLTGACLVRVTGDIDLDVVPALRAELEAAVAERPWVIVDLSRTGTVDSVGLSVLVAAGLAARRAGGDLLLAAPSPFLRSVLRSARLATVLTVHDTLPRAMSAVRR